MIIPRVQSVTKVPVAIIPRVQLVTKVPVVIVPKIPKKVITPTTTEDAKLDLELKLKVNPEILAGNQQVASTNNSYILSLKK